MTAADHDSLRAGGAGGGETIRSLSPHSGGFRCITDAGELNLSAVIARHLRVGDRIVASRAEDPVQEILVSRVLQKRKPWYLYACRIGYVAKPKPDSRDSLFMAAAVEDGGLGVRAVYLLNTAVRDYFYSLPGSNGGASTRTFYELLGADAGARPCDLRLAYRLRRLELESDHAAAAESRSLERAFNILADPELRSCYDTLMRHPEAPALFPYGGFGHCLVAGRPAADGDTFFAHAILAYRPEQRTRSFRAPLRCLDYLDGYAVYRDSRRKVQVLVDPTLVPFAWDQTWNQWKHLVPAKLGINGTFVKSGKYRLVKGEWRFIEWETSLPSRLQVTAPSDLATHLSSAYRAYQRFGEYFDSIQRIKDRLERQALSTVELAEACRQLGIPPDFDIAQFCWRPDYDPFFYKELKKRSRNVYLLRGEYIFELPHAIVVEVPQLGHASYVFRKPDDVRTFLQKYTSSGGKDEIRHNRENIADALGFIGRVTHGRNPRTWLRELQCRIGEPLDYTLAV